MKPFQKAAIYYETLINYGIGPLLMTIVVPIIFIPITDYLISVLTTALDTSTQLIYLLVENIILVGLMFLFYFIGTKIGSLIFTEKVKVIYYSDSHRILRDIFGFFGYALGLLIVGPFFINNLVVLLNELFLTDWNIDPVYGLMTYFLNFYFILFLAFLIGAGLRLLLLLLVDYIFYRTQSNNLVSAIQLR